LPLLSSLIPSTFTLIQVEPRAALSRDWLPVDGWHSGAILARLVIDHYLSHVASLGSPGVDEMRWIRPVRPGDILRLRVKVLETRVSSSKPDRGLVTRGIGLINQRDEPVMSLRIVNLLSVRPAA